MKKAPADASSPSSAESPPPPVRLRPLLGVEPERYLPLVFSGVLLLIFASVFLLPAVRNPGVAVLIYTSPTGSSVYVDNQRVGSTPVEVFLERGTRELRLEHPWFHEETFTYTAGNQLFRIPFHTRPRELWRRLELAEPEALITDSAKDFTQWALAEEPTARRRSPRVLADAVAAWYADPASQPVPGGPAAGESYNDSGEIAALLHLAPAFLSHQGAGADFLRASTLDRAAGGVLSAFTALEVVQNFVRLEKTSRGFFRVLDAVLPDAAAAELRAGNWYRTARERHATALAAAGYEEVPPDVGEIQRARFAGVPFIRVPPIQTLVGMQRDDSLHEDPLRVPHLVRSDSFWLMQSAVSNSLFGEFLADNPEWGPGATATLRERELVTQDHLAAWNNREELNEEQWLRQPVRYVSYPLAQEFAAWFNARLQAEGYNLVARLPYSEEWELAALLDGADLYDPVFRDGFLTGPKAADSGHSGNLGFYHLMGNTWEWTASAFAPAAYALRPFEVDMASLAETQESLHAELPFRAVRGGSWGNRSDEVTLAAVGGQPHYWSSPFLGFRLALASPESIRMSQR